MSSSKQATAYTSGAKISATQTLGQAKYNRTTGVFRIDTARTRKVMKERKKKMGWFKRKFAQWCREAWENENDVEVVSSRDMGRNDHSSDERITLRLEKAIGGHIVTVSKYNGKIDRHRENTYLIKEEDNLEEALTGVFISEKLSM
jgi:hypothetical protein